MPPSVRRVVPRRRFLLAIVLVSATLAADACIFRRSAGANADEDDSVTLHVENHNTLDMVVYNVRSGTRERIGDVTALSKATFTLHVHRYPAGEVQLFAHGIGSGGGVTSEVLAPFPGQIVEWTIETDLMRSFVVVRD